MDSYARDIRDHFETVSAGYGATVHEYAAFRRGEALAHYARGRVLEIGCGSGAVTHHLAGKGDVYVGDFALGMARVTQEQLSMPATVLDGGRLPFRNNVFDAVISSEVIYYLPEPMDLVSESFRVLRSGGTMALSVMHSFWQKIDQLRLKLGAVGSVFGSAASPYRGGLTVQKVSEYLEQVGCHEVECKPVVLFPMRGFHRVNLVLERTPLSKMAFFWVITGTKP